MFEYPILPCKVQFNREEYRDKVLGCWMGKNIGGTLGGPYEGKLEMNDVTFYTGLTDGKPLPNDDLDLQLVWLTAIERRGIWHLNERTLGEYWLSYILGHMSEYGVCQANIRNGLIPPLSGACNNERYKDSNGAWIRSEIWACLFPGSPDEAAYYGYCDSCCDHAGDGIYAEMFTCALEAAAFVESDLQKLLDIALARIPQDSQIARAVKIARDAYAKKLSFKDARNQVWDTFNDGLHFRAAVNIGYVMLALLYGEGDFGKTVALAVNCGDDTDCTAGTAGSVLGIIQGRKAIPEEWTKPIGDSIVTCTIDTFSFSNVPADINELTNRVICCAYEAWAGNPQGLPSFTDGATYIAPEYHEVLKTCLRADLLLWGRDPYSYIFELPSTKIFCHYDQGPYIQPGQPKKLAFSAVATIGAARSVSVKLSLPDGWKATPAAGVSIPAKCDIVSPVEITLTPSDNLAGGMVYIPVTVQLSDRLAPDAFNLPLQCGGPYEFDTNVPCQDWWEFDLLRNGHRRKDFKM